LEHDAEYGTEMSERQPRSSASDPYRSDTELIYAFRGAVRELSVREAAEASGLSVGTVVRLTQGQTGSIHPATRRKLVRFLEKHSVYERAVEISSTFGLAKHLNVPLQDFLGGAATEEDVWRWYMAAERIYHGDDIGEADARALEMTPEQAEAFEALTKALYSDTVRELTGVTSAAVTEFWISDGIRNLVKDYLREIGPWGEEKLRKRNALDSFKDFLAAGGKVPGWWYQLSEQLEQGKL
jgi:hypothetical protein